MRRVSGFLQRIHTAGRRTRTLSRPLGALVSNGRSQDTPRSIRERTTRRQARGLSNAAPSVRPRGMHVKFTRALLVLCAWEVHAKGSICTHMVESVVITIVHGIITVAALLFGVWIRGSARNGFHLLSTPQIHCSPRFITEPSFCCCMCLVRKCAEFCLYQTAVWDSFPQRV